MFAAFADVPLYNAPILPPAVVVLLNLNATSLLFASFQINGKFVLEANGKAAMYSVAKAAALA